MTLSLIAPTLPLVEQSMTGFNPFCTTDQPEPGQSNTKPYASADSSSISFDLKSGETVECWWFVVAQTGFDVYNTKYVCPYGYDMTGKIHDDLKRDCNLQPYDVSVPAPGAERRRGRWSMTRRWRSTARTARPSWTCRQAQFALREIIPPDYEFMSLWCVRAERWPGEWPGLQYTDVTQQYPGGEVTGSLDSGAFYCDWFNREAPAWSSSLR